MISDLDDQFRASSQDTGRHRYFLLPYKNPSWGQAIEQTSFIPLPNQILNEYRNVECASFTGLIPEIHRCVCTRFCVFICVWTRSSVVVLVYVCLHVFMCVRFSVCVFVLVRVCSNSQ